MTEILVTSLQLCSITSLRRDDFSTPNAFRESSAHCEHMSKMAYPGYLERAATGWQRTKYLKSSKKLCAHTMNFTDMSTQLVGYQDVNMPWPLTRPHRAVFRISLPLRSSPASQSERYGHVGAVTERLEHQDQP